MAKNSDNRLVDILVVVFISSIVEPTVSSGFAITYNFSRIPF